MSKIRIPGPGESHIADVVVIGGGIVGTATAFYLSRAGLKVILVEMREGLSTLTSAESMECFRAEFTEPVMARLALQSIEVWEHFSEVIDLKNFDIDIHRQGYLFMTDDKEKAQALKVAVGKYQENGVDGTEYLNGEQIRERFPWVSPTVVAGTFRSQDGWFKVHEATQGLAKGSNASFFLKTEVTGIDLDSGGVCGVRTNRGKISTRAVVNAAGPFASRLAGLVGLDLPLEPVRRQKAFIANQSLVPADAPFTVDVGRECYWRPETGGGLIGWIDPNEPSGPPTENCLGDYDFPAITLDYLQHLSPFWEKVVKGLKKPDVKVSAGQYVYTPDLQPLLGPVEEIKGFYLSCGYWCGVMIAPAVGDWMAKIITNEMEPEENPLSVQRFKGGGGKTAGSLLSR